VNKRILAGPGRFRISPVAHRPLALCPPWHAKTHAPYPRGRLVTASPSRITAALRAGTWRSPGASCRARASRSVGSHVRDRVRTDDVREVGHAEHPQVGFGGSEAECFVMWKTSAHAHSRSRLSATPLRDRLGTRLGVVEQPQALPAQVRAPRRQGEGLRSLFAAGRVHQPDGTGTTVPTATAVRVSTTAALVAETDLMRPNLARDLRS